MLVITYSVKILCYMAKQRLAGQLVIVCYAFWNIKLNRSFDRSIQFNKLFYAEATLKFHIIVPKIYKL